MSMNAVNVGARSVFGEYLHSSETDGNNINLNKPKKYRYYCLPIQSFDIVI